MCWEIVSNSFPAWHSWTHPCITCNLKDLSANGRWAVFRTDKEALLLPVKSYLSACQWNWTWTPWLYWCLTLNTRLDCCFGSYIARPSIPGLLSWTAAVGMLINATAPVGRELVHIASSLGMRVWLETRHFFLRKTPRYCCNETSDWNSSTKGQFVALA